MPGVDVTITGILYDRQNRTAQNVTLIGEALLTGLGVGGGPIEPEPTPPGICPSPGRPTHPIARPGRPVDPGYGLPDEPIIPPMPGEPPPDGGDKPPPEDHGGWGFVSEWSRWGYFPAEESAQPKRR